MIAAAILFASVAALSGIFAVGSGQHWHFVTADYFRGKRNAILYLWVMASTIFSICHAGTLVQFGVDNGWSLIRSGDTTWMVIHSCVGMLLTFAHIFVATTLAKEVGPTDKYLWGKNSAAS